VKEHISYKKNDLKKGYVKEPIAIGFKFEKVVIDMLHLFLRITDVLEQNLLIIKLKTLDAANNSGPDDNLDNQPILKRFIDYITNDLRINRVYYVSEKQIVLRNLDGDEKLKIFENINIENLFKDTRLEKAIEIGRVSTLLLKTLKFLFFINYFFLSYGTIFLTFTCVLKINYILQK
jgi:hypothetical protein